MGLLFYYLQDPYHYPEIHSTPPPTPSDTCGVCPYAPQPAPAPSPPSVAPPPSTRRLQDIPDIYSASELWNQWTTNQILEAGCTPLYSFTTLTFDNAATVRSNLGGQGGRCVDTTYDDGTFASWRDLCDEAQPNPPTNAPATRQNVLIRNLGRMYGADEEISILITN